MSLHKNNIAVFFSIVFMIFITAPTVISIIDDSIDVTFIYSNSEEETGKQQAEKLKVELSTLKINEFIFSSSKKVSHLRHKNKNYTKPLLNMVFPPPEQV
ncbi:MAG: hypothetical protein HWD85_02915 [Flavobacteriaceae bacterium]|nr:hypothetical protein [Flavobacteriaceae bacterium]